MNGFLRHPFLVFLASFAAMALAALVAASASRRKVEAELREDFGVVQAATLTLLGLIIGFSFSMALNRYDLRKSYEEAEANAIGTEYVRADLLPAADAAKIRSLLRDYLAQRIRFYSIHDEQTIREINSQTATLQNQLWSSVRAPALAQPTSVAALVVAGMNDVLNSQSYTQAAWWNRIPVGAWGLLVIVAVCSNALVGWGARSAKAKSSLLLILPLIVAVSFLLIADIDSPRGGVIHVSPQNLLSLAQSLGSQGTTPPP